MDDSYNPKSMSNINVLKTQFIREFDMKDLGSAKVILGMLIQRDRQLEKLHAGQMLEKGY